MRKIVALLYDCQGWWAKYCVLKRKFGMEGELEVVDSHATWRNCMRIFMRKDGRKRLAKEDFGQEMYVKEFGRKEEVRL